MRQCIKKYNFFFYYINMIFIQNNFKFEDSDWNLQSSQLQSFFFGYYVYITKISYSFS